MRFKGSQVSLEDMTQIANSMHQKNVLRSKKDTSENGGKGSSIQKPTKNSNVRFNGIQEPQMQNNSYKGGKDCNKNPQFSNNERAKEHVNALRDAQRNPRNGLAPRFKRCIDGEQ